MKKAKVGSFDEAYARQRQASRDSLPGPNPRPAVCVKPPARDEPAAGCALSSGPRPAASTVRRTTALAVLRMRPARSARLTPHWNNS